MSHSVLVRRSLTAVGHCRVVLYSAETPLFVHNDHDVFFLFSHMVYSAFVEGNSES